MTLPRNWLQLTRFARPRCKTLIDFNASRHYIYIQVIDMIVPFWERGGGKIVQVLCFKFYVFTPSDVFLSELKKLYFFHPHLFTPSSSAAVPPAGVFLLQCDVNFMWHGYYIVLGESDNFKPLKISIIMECKPLHTVKKQFLPTSPQSDQPFRAKTVSSPQKSPTFAQLCSQVMG